jgi:RHS repeat-associated protein
MYYLLNFFMKPRLAILFFFILYMGFAVGQQTPPAAYGSAVKINYVRVWEATAPETNAATLVTRPRKDVTQSTSYFDGLGRPLQSVTKQGSMATGESAADMVNAIVYDGFGREQSRYLPFVANNNGGNVSVNDGLFKLNPFQQQAAFMQAQYGSQNETWFYGQTLFEPSPLNRVEKTMVAGNSWVGGNRGLTARYWINTVTDDVKKWTVYDVTNDWGTYTMTGAYAAGELFKNVTVDEHGKQTVEFKTKDNKVILKKVQLTAAADNGTGSGYPGWLSVYYIYDNLGYLRLVVQPGGVDLLTTNGWNITALNGDILNEQCFRYEYDARQRIVRKKVPGAGEICLVYDQWDRLVLSQDANLRASNKWQFTKYDQLNRPIMTGLYTDNTHITLTSMQSYLDTQNMARFENYQTVTFPLYSLDQTFPVVVLNDLLNITYYDDYSWTGWYGSYGTRDNSLDGFFASPGNTYPYPQPVTASADARGLMTGLWDKTGELAVMHYDDKGRIVQTQHYNYSGGADVTTTQYNFSGQVLQKVLRRPKNGTNARVDTLITKMEYDDLARLVTVKKKINNGPEKIISQQEYDKLGQLKKKILGANIENLNYEYNIRGWVLGINRDFVKDASINKFGFELGYDKAGTIISGAAYTTPQYNGNIGGLIWKSIGDNQKRKYDFTYDAASRLTAADFTQWTSGSTFNKSAGMDFSVSNLTYDANGNITTMLQKGWKPGGSVTIDSLGYFYFNNGNRLKTVVDGRNDANTGLGDFRSSTTYMAALGGTKSSSATDYAYDGNGNLVKDLNKDLSNGGGNGIVYNHLNLPVTIYVANKGSIEYIYNSTGTKLKKIQHETGKPDKTTLYLEGFVYENDTLQYINQEEGRIRFVPAVGTAPASFAYDYFVNDQLGNVRMVLTEERKQHIYPAATLEGNQGTATDAVYIEKDYYSIDPVYVVPKSAATGITDYPNKNGGPNATDPPVNNNPNSNVTANSQLLYQLNATTNKTGLGITLKVMAGDTINIFGKSYFFVAGSIPGSSDPIPMLDLLNAFAGTSGMAGKGISGNSLNNNTALASAISTLLGTQGAQTPTQPKAYINWILFDEQFNYAGGGFDRAGTSGSVKTHNNVTIPSIVVPKNGYIFVYCSNESSHNVFFDNLQVIHTRGSLLEETHYYPFGLAMSGISSKYFQSSSAGCGCAGNRKGFNGNEIQNKEFSDGSGLEVYDFNARTYDQQTGRFIQADPMVFSGDFLEETEEVNGGVFNINNLEVYGFAYNNPIKNSDPDGKCPNCITAAIGAGIGALFGGGWELGKQLWRNGKVTSWKAVGGATVQGAITGGAAGFTGGSSLLVTGAVTGTANVAGGIANNAIQGKPITIKSVTTDFIVGGLLGIGGKAFGQYISKFLKSSAGSSIASKVSGLAKELGIKSGQSKLSGEGADLVKGYLTQMKNGTFNAEKGAAGFLDKGQIILTEGNHRMNAAIQYALETGDKKYIEALIKNGNFFAADPAKYGYKVYNFPTK